MLGRLRKGRYSGEPVLDYLENKATKALYITAQHIVYVNLGRQSVRWALSLRHLFSVTTAGDLPPTAVPFINQCCWLFTIPM